MSAVVCTREPDLPVEALCRVGRQLLQAVRGEPGSRVTLVLASMPDAVAFYEKVGMPRMVDVCYYARQR